MIFPQPVNSHRCSRFIRKQPNHSHEEPAENFDIIVEAEVGAVPVHPDDMFRFNVAIFRELKTMNEKRRPARSTFQFRLSTVLWITLVIGAFFAGRSFQLQSVDAAPSKDTDSWDPGYSSAIAIAGSVDLDGDGKDDVARLKSLIEANGGTVVAFQTQEGSVQGKIDASTRYIVLADGPANDVLVRDASRHSVEMISLNQLLDWMGVQREPVASTSNGFRTRKPVD